MEEFVLDNGQLQVAVQPLGAEVTRITGKNGAQLMWEGTPSLWGHFSPLLFPFPGTLANGYYLSGGKKYPVPQGGFVFRPLQSGELKVMAGKGFRVPNLKEMYLYGVANADLRPERLWNYEAAWKQRLLQGRLTYGVNLFYLKADNLIATMMVTELGRRANFNTGSTEHYGAEVEAAWQINRHWHLSTNHSYLHMPEDKRIPAAPTYKGYLGARYSACRLEVTAGVQCVHGLWKDTDDNGFGDSEEDTFVLLNAGIAYHLFPQVKLWLRGENLLAQRYEINYGFPMPKATVMGGIHVNF